MEPCPSKDLQAPMDADAEDPGQAASGSSSGYLDLVQDPQAQDSQALIPPAVVG